MLTKDEAHRFAEEWIAAWNCHDLDAIMSHYEDDVQLTSPVAIQLLNDPSGTVVGKANLRAYFQRGLEAFPHLEFKLKEVMWGVNSIVLFYANQRGTFSGEFMEFSPNGKVARVIANYSA